jgi:hypothetical protein
MSQTWAAVITAASNRAKHTHACAAQKSLVTEPALGRSTLACCLPREDMGRRRSQMKTRNVLISGAGVAESALAYWLHRHGFSPTVVERARSPREAERISRKVCPALITSGRSFWGCLVRWVGAVTPTARCSS